MGNMIGKTPYQAGQQRRSGAPNAMSTSQTKTQKPVFTFTPLGAPNHGYVTDTFTTTSTKQPSKPKAGIPKSARNTALAKKFEAFYNQQQYQPENLTESPPNSNVKYVDWALKHRTAMNPSQKALLGTDSMTNCAAMIVVDKTDKNKPKVSLMHANMACDFADEKQPGHFWMGDSSKTLNPLLGNLKKEGFNIQNCDFYIAQGSHTDSQSSYNYFQMLQQQGIANNKMHFIPSRENSPNGGENIVVTPQGKIYRATGNLASQLETLNPNNNNKTGKPVYILR